jgi:hypothetical protein
MRKLAATHLAVFVFAIGAVQMRLYAAPPPAESTVHLDINGIAPGMPAQQAYERLKAWNPHVRVGIGLNQVPGASDKPIPLTMAAEVMDPAAPEAITLWLTTPPGPQVVWAIGRVLEYDPKQPLLKDNVLASLRQKFGPEIQTMGPTIFWAFDEHGVRAGEATMHNLSCINASRWNLAVAAPQAPASRPSHPSSIHLFTACAIDALRFRGGSKSDPYRTRRSALRLSHYCCDLRSATGLCVAEGVSGIPGACRRR